MAKGADKEKDRGVKLIDAGPPLQRPPTRSDEYFWSVIGVYGQVSTRSVMGALGREYMFIERMLNNNFILVKGPNGKHHMPVLPGDLPYRIASAVPPPERATSRTIIVHVMPTNKLARHRLLYNDIGVDIDVTTAKVILEDMQFPLALASRVFACFAGKGSAGARAKQTLQFFVELISEEAALTCLGKWDAFISKSVDAYIHVHQLSRTNWRSQHTRGGGKDIQGVHSWKLPEEPKPVVLSEMQRINRFPKSVIALSYVEGTPLERFSCISAEEAAASIKAPEPEFRWESKSKAPATKKERQRLQQENHAKPAGGKGQQADKAAVGSRKASDVSIGVSAGGSGKSTPVAKKPMEQLPRDRMLGLGKADEPVARFVWRADDAPAPPAKRELDGNWRDRASPPVSSDDLCALGKVAPHARMTVRDLEADTHDAEVAKALPDLVDPDLHREPPRVAFAAPPPQQLPRYTNPLLAQRMPDIAAKLSAMQRRCRELNASIQRMAAV
eukprot:TRINITY_DN14244_c0_g1_i1.p1 TRINITY_DN14244_c0_g1~~TRINITY_DN14244_c0_g1_i1.p1  ORF type:complete len:501 (+),score=186.00 TRINITY_DN14244_c0_g1_i1:42-1544(+)